MYSLVTQCAGILTPPAEQLARFDEQVHQVPVLCEGGASVPQVLPVEEDEGGPHTAGGVPEQDKGRPTGADCVSLRRDSLPDS